MNKLVLEGCTPEPLMGYLKALGVLRLVSEQADDEARGFWRDGVFVLETKLDAEGLLRFFREEYGPTPIIVPWSGNDFFKIDIQQNLYANTPTGTRIVEAFGSVAGERLSGYREVIHATLHTMESLGLGKKEHLEKTAGAKLKVHFLSRLRSTLPACLVEWMDVAAQVAGSKFVPNVLLGSGGGSDGNTHFSDNFMQNLWDVLPDFDGQRGIELKLGGKAWSGKKPPKSLPGRLTVTDVKANGFTLVTTLSAPELLKELNAANPGDPILPREIERRLLGRRPSRASGAEVIATALFDKPSRALLEGRTSALFDSGGVGGPNAGVGMEREALLNPWDFILAIEGTLCLAGAVSKRQGVNARRASVYPFSVRMTATGFGGGIDQENGQHEVWLPLWDRSLQYAELRMLLSNGRCEVGRRPARTGLDFARAVASVGVDAGIPAFARYGIVKGRVGGDNYYTAVSAGLFPVKNRASVGLIENLDAWMESLGRATSEDKTPVRFKIARRRIEAAIFAFCRHSTGSDDAARFQTILAALGAAERESSIGTFAQKIPEGTKRPRISPISGVESAWLTAANDHSPEFRLARAAAFLHSGPKSAGPVRRYLEPVEQHPKFESWAWGEGGGHVVWGGGDLARNLGAVLARRLMDAEKGGEPGPSFGGAFPASLADVAAFLKGETDDAKLDDLLWGLCLVERGTSREIPNAEPTALPRAYALLKLTMLPGRLAWSPSGGRYSALRLNRPAPGDTASGVSVRPEPAIPARLRAGDIPGACEVAVRRLRASGFQPLGGLSADGSRRAIDWSGGGVSPPRLLAALLFPIPDNAANELADLVLRRPLAESLT